MIVDNKVKHVALRTRLLASLVTVAIAWCTGVPLCAARHGKPVDRPIVSMCELAERPADFLTIPIRTTLVAEPGILSPLSVGSPDPTQCRGRALEVTWGHRLPIDTNRSLWQKVERTFAARGRDRLCFTVSGRLYFVPGNVECHTAPSDPGSEIVTVTSCDPMPKPGPHYVLIIDAIHTSERRRPNHPR